jgi:RNA polymerase sigma-70 factor (ECF subfamily)
MIGRTRPTRSESGRHAIVVRRATHPASPRSEAAPDADVLQRLAAGEIDALGELYDRYHGAVRRFVARATSDAEDVDDLVHATFLAAAQSAERYDGRPCCRPWLIGIAARLLRRRHRSFGRFLALLASLRGIGAAVTDPRPLLQARGDVERALAKLSDAKRITLLMAEVEGLSCAEIAAALEVPIGTVWTRLHAARREIRHAIAAPEEGEGS